MSSPAPIDALAIVGRGQVGSAIHAALVARGVAASLLAARALPARLGARAYLLAVRDPVIGEVARAVLARHEGPPPLLLHCAGGLSSSVLREAGAEAAAVMHPLLPFSAGRVPVLEAALFAVEGDEPARALAAAIAARVGGRVLALDAASMARYHAAASLASNHVLALVDLAREILTDLGVEPGLAAAGLSGLFGGVAQNLAALGLPRALTGPIARGDAAAVRRHLDALPAGTPARAAYLATAGRLVAIARRKGEAALDGLDSIEALLDLYATELYDAGDLD